MHVVIVTTVDSSVKPMDILATSTPPPETPLGHLRWRILDFRYQEAAQLPLAVAVQRYLQYLARSPLLHLPLLAVTLVWA